MIDWLADSSIFYSIQTSGCLANEFHHDIMIGMKMQCEIGKNWTRFAERTFAVLR
jgi:hypothetical protein